VLGEACVKPVNQQTVRSRRKLDLDAIDGATALTQDGMHDRRDV
jgi:hypothetical protein